MHIFTNYSKKKPTKKQYDIHQFPKKKNYINLSTNSSINYLKKKFFPELQKIHYNSLKKDTKEN